MVVASGGIGGNFDLVRQNWPTGWGDPPRDLVAGVPDYVDGALLQATERAGARVINLDRMWHYPEGIKNHSPVWSHHGIRILAGPSSLWLDARGIRFPAPLFPGFDALGALRQVTASGYAYSWFVLDAETLAKEFALSGSEQNGDLTGRDLRLLAGRVRPGPTPEVRAFTERASTSSAPASVPELAAQMNQLAGEHLIDGDALQQTIEARDQQVHSGLGKDPQVVATAAARRFIGDRLLRVVPPHELLDPKHPGAGLAGSGGPLVAVRLHILTRKTLGGLETDLEGRVLTRRRLTAARGVRGGRGGRLRRRRSPRLPLAGGNLPGRLPVHRPDRWPRPWPAPSSGLRGRIRPVGTGPRGAGPPRQPRTRGTSRRTRGPARASSASARSRAICWASRTGSAGGSPCAALSSPTCWVILNRSASRWTRAASMLSMLARSRASSAVTSVAHPVSLVTRAIERR